MHRRTGSVQSDLDAQQLEVPRSPEGSFSKGASSHACSRFKLILSFISSVALVALLLLVIMPHLFVTISRPRPIQ